MTILIETSLVQHCKLSCYIITFKCKIFYNNKLACYVSVYRDSRKYFEANNCTKKSSLINLCLIYYLQTVFDKRIRKYKNRVHWFGNRKIEVETYILFLQINKDQQLTSKIFSQWSINSYIWD